MAKNLSSTTVPAEVQRILSLGQNFSVPATDKRHLPLLEILKNFESRSFLIDHTVRNEARIELTNMVLNNLNKTKHTNQFKRTFSKQLRACNKFLDENKQLLITRADKGQSTVIMDWDDYERKMLLLLNDEKTYKKLDENQGTLE